MVTVCVAMLAVAPGRLRTNLGARSPPGRADPPASAGRLRGDDRVRLVGYGDNRDRYLCRHRRRSRPPGTEHHRTGLWPFGPMPAVNVTAVVLHHAPPPHPSLPESPEDRRRRPCRHHRPCRRCRQSPCLPPFPGDPGRPRSPCDPRAPAAPRAPAPPRSFDRSESLKSPSSSELSLTFADETAFFFRCLAPTLALDS